MVEDSVDHSIPKQTEWHKFLDSLAWLGDYKCGGKTVTAIAVESSATSPIFWIACNTTVSPDVLHHIQSILSCLEQEASSDTPSSDEVIRTIARDSIELSWVRVKDYSRRLKGTLTAVDSHKPRLTLEQSHREQLESFLNLPDSDVLIDLSMNLKRSSLMRQLCELIHSSDEKTLWKQVRHLLGRLCSWVRASRYVVFRCKTFRHCMMNARVQTVDMSSVSMTDFHLPWREPGSILHEVLPEFHESRLYDALKARQNHRQVDQITQCISRMMRGKFNPDFHAEITLLLHFHSQKLKFIAGDRYIACSKASCYCCDLYIRSHPADILPRHSHGNIWVNWAAPELHTGSIHQEADVLQNSLNSVKSDLLYQLMSGRVHTRRPPDSTTGLGTTEPPHEVA